MQECINDKQKHQRRKRVPIVMKKEKSIIKTNNFSCQADIQMNMIDKSTVTHVTTMIDKSTDTIDLVKKEREKKLLEKFKKQTETKKKQAELFKQVIGTPKAVIDDIEDE
uniref:Uncharacterized protein n=1 Tax=viral metagenome TaxID=1070528 RepID=A0A6C0CSS4_9ZZZZ